MNAGFVSLVIKQTWNMIYHINHMANELERVQRSTTKTDLKAICFLQPVSIVRPSVHSSFRIKSDLIILFIHIFCSCWYWWASVLLFRARGSHIGCSVCCLSPNFHPCWFITTFQTNDLDWFVKNKLAIPLEARIVNVCLSLICFEILFSLFWTNYKCNIPMKMVDSICIAVTNFKISITFLLCSSCKFTNYHGQVTSVESGAFFWSVHIKLVFFQWMYFKWYPISSLIMPVNILIAYFVFENAIFCFVDAMCFSKWTAFCA